MLPVDFDSVFTKVSTEKTLKLQESGHFLTFISPKHIRKNFAKFLFNKKFGVYPTDVKSVAFRKKVKIRTKTRRDTKYKVMKKFYFGLPEGFKIEE